MIALFPGSFDPFTNGHLDVAERTAAIADRLIIGVGVNPAKRGFTAPRGARHPHQESNRTPSRGGSCPPERCHHGRSPSRLGATLIIKGVRGAQDTDYEASQAALNLEVGGVDTWWVPTRPELAHVSSSAVRELLILKKDVSRYVPPAVAQYLTENRN